MPTANRPVNLDLTTIRFPLTAIASILHRISGVGLFVLAPLIIWFWSLSLRDASGFASVSALIQGAGIKLLLWLFLAALFYHLVAGIKHLLMDWGYGEEIASANRATIVSLTIFILLIIFAGVWLWQV